MQLLVQVTVCQLVFVFTMEVESIRKGEVSRVLSEAAYPGPSQSSPSEDRSVGAATQVAMDEPTQKWLHTSQR